MVKLVGLHAALIAAVFALFAAVAEAQETASETAANPSTETSVFLRPRISTQEREIAALLQLGQQQLAAERLEDLLVAHPDVESLYFIQGLVRGFSGDMEGAIAAFQTAWTMGDRQLRELAAAPRNAAFLADPRLKALLDQPDPAPALPEPVGAKGGIAEVVASATIWDPVKHRLITRFALPKRLRSKPVMTGNDPVARRLRALMRAGKASGLAGVLYDNRDRDHGQMRLGKFPQLALVEYSPLARSFSVDYGLNAQILFDAVTLGNSSTAVTGPQWRSQGRFGMTQGVYPSQFYQSYRENQIYLFPEHLDHDPVSQGGKGDVFPANIPYLLFSQGSSSSELRMLDAVAVILAALPPKTRAALEAEGLLAAAVQQVFRRGQAGILTDEDYLSGRAHPTVFDANASEPDRMIELAQAIAANQIPPMVAVQVVSEPPSIAPFSKGLNEHLFTTPSAIARIHRTLERTRKTVLSAAETKDPNGRALIFRWVLLRGDPERVRIAPQDDQGLVAEIEIDWHDRFEAPAPAGMTTQRVDIGVFAYNGAHWSAPAFYSVSFPPTEQRFYDAQGRLAEIDYRDPEIRKRYADPLLFLRRNWRDQFAYTQEGRLKGWTRYRGEDQTAFSRHGLKVIEQDPQGRPLITEFVDYALDQTNQYEPRSVETATGQKARYKYKSDQDELGEPVLLRGSE